MEWKMDVIRRGNRGEEGMEIGEGGEGRGEGKGEKKGE